MTGRSSYRSSGPGPPSPGRLSFCPGTEARARDRSTERCAGRARPRPAHQVVVIASPEGRAGRPCAVVGCASAGLLRGAPGTSAGGVGGDPGGLPGAGAQIPSRPRRRPTADDRPERRVGRARRPRSPGRIRCDPGQAGRGHCAGGRVDPGPGTRFRGPSPGSFRAAGYVAAAGDLSKRPGRAASGGPRRLLVVVGRGSCRSTARPPLGHGPRFRPVCRLVPGRDRPARPGLPGLAPASHRRTASASGDRRASGQSSRPLGGRSANRSWLVGATLGGRRRSRSPLALPGAAGPRIAAAR